MRFVSIALLLGFFVELGVMIAVGRRIDVLPVLLLVAGAGAAGVMVIRAAGLGMAQALRASRLDQKFATRDAAAQFLLLPAGLLLIVPGFISDALGLALLLPPLRRWLAGRFTGKIQVQTGFRRSPVIEGEVLDITEEPER